MKKMHSKFKKGAASFYIVAFSTLILVIIAASFASVIISAVTRTSNDDLSQSAYDSALAGVEDAKLAYINYAKCIQAGEKSAGSKPTGGSAVSCADIIYWMEHPDCDMVGHILGRIGKDDSGEVQVSDTVTTGPNVDNNLNQAYTCVVVNTTLGDYRSSLSATNQTKIVKAHFGSSIADKIKKVRINWYSNREGSVYHFTNTAGSRVAFQPLMNIAASTPPTLSVGLVQTANAFNLSDFDESSGNRTNRATIYLVPTNNKNLADDGTTETYIGALNSNGENVVTSAVVAKSNSKYDKNLPSLIWCNSSATSEYACSAVVELPEPIGGTRSNETFMFAVSIPYGQPNTDFSIEFWCENGVRCSDETDTVGNQSLTRAEISGVQVLVDSTGRANDLYRRIETRLEAQDTTFAVPFYAIQLLGNTGDILMEKDITVLREYNF